MIGLLSKWNRYQYLTQPKAQSTQLHKTRTIVNRMKYTHFLPFFEGFFAVVILSLQNISSVLTDHLRINVTRQSDGDILVFEDKVHCASFNAKCSRVPNNERETTKYNICDSCKCLSGNTTYVSTENQCINTNEMTTLNCRIFRQKQVTVLKKSNKAISRPVQAYRCEIKEQHPEFYSDNKGADTWIRMIDVDFSLRSRFKTGNRRLRNWLVTFNNNNISKMLSKYAGRIVKLKLSCRMRRRQRKQTDLCVIFKISGSVTGGNSTLARHPNDTYRPPSTRPTRVDTLWHTANGYSTESPSAIKTSLPSGNNTAQDQKSKSGRNNHVIWIIITVLIVIIIVLIAVIVFICFKRRKTKRTNEEDRRRDIRLHEYDVPIKSQLQGVHGGNPQGADHIYATISEMQNANSATCSSPNEYQELNPSDREKDASHYQPLVQPSELQYVDILPHQAEVGSN